MFLILFTLSVFRCTIMPSATDVVHEVTGAFLPSISTKQRRHEAGTGGWVFLKAQRLGMYSPLSSATQRRVAPSLALTSVPSIVRVTIFDFYLIITENLKNLSGKSEVCFLNICFISSFLIAVHLLLLM